jgi:hypothetical protein
MAAMGGKLTFAHAGVVGQSEIEGRSNRETSVSIPVTRFLQELIRITEQEMDLAQAACQLVAQTPRG